ncbi:hypothetical protein J4228_02860 [Candidatus Woesearchaeota archaeon]|nr:hypothetical protein [Candidatus Woesearchaeota archaeon]
MKYLSGEEKRKAQQFMDKAAEVALHSTCFRSRCGTVIVKDNTIIGEGFNSPPQNECLESCLKDTLPASFKSDKTCCVHAEQRAIMDALRRNSAKIERSQLYFIRLDEQGEKQYAGDPYCTICSKMALDVRIGEFVLWHEQGICVYDTKEYNARSFRFFPK